MLIVVIPYVSYIYYIKLDQSSRNISTLVSLIYNSPLLSPSPSNSGPLHYKIRALLPSVLSQTGGGVGGWHGPLSSFSLLLTRGG